MLGLRGGVSRVGFGCQGIPPLACSFASPEVAAKFVALLQVAFEAVLWRQKGWCKSAIGGGGDDALLFIGLFESGVVTEAAKPALVRSRSMVDHAPAGVSIGIGDTQQ